MKIHGREEEGEDREGSKKEEHERRKKFPPPLLSLFYYIFYLIFLNHFSFILISINSYKNLKKYQISCRNEFIQKNDDKLHS